MRAAVPAALALILFAGPALAADPGADHPRPPGMPGEAAPAPAAPGEGQQAASRGGEMVRKDAAGKPEAPPPAKP